jgi:RND family efflux transporter MFP subunit
MVHPRSVVQGVAAAVAMSLLAGCGASAVPAASQALIVPQTPPLALTQAFRGTVRSTVQVSGQVVSLETARLYFHNGGTVATVSVVNGQDVRQGQVLASLDTGNLPYQIADARLSVEQAQLNLNNLALSQAAATTAAQAAAAAIARRQAQLSLAQAQISLKADELTLAEDEVVAPFSGVVNNVSIAPGDQVGGFETVMVLSDPRQEAFVADVGQTVAQEMHPGQSAVLAFDATGGGSYRAQVASVSIPTAAQIAQAETNGVTPPLPTVTFSVTGLRSRPLLGATFTATVTLAEAKGVVYVPTDAIRQFNGFTYVDVLRHGDIVEVPVQVGLQGDTTTVVTKGLVAGERVVEP